MILKINLKYFAFLNKKIAALYGRIMLKNNLILYNFMNSNYYYIVWQSFTKTNLNSGNILP